MDLYANKNIKITRNALTGRDLLTLSEKHSDKKRGLNFKKASLNKKFYTTKSTFDLKKQKKKG
jgi:metal-dependent hydrolase (beta-lactamase superfamily II)